MSTPSIVALVGLDSLFFMSCDMTMIPHLDEQLARAQDESCIRVANPSCELAKGSRVARVRVSAKQHLPGLAVPLLRRSGKALHFSQTST